MQDYWDAILKSKAGAGGFIWAFVDEDVKRVDKGGILDSQGNMAPDGIVGPYREREASFYTVKQLWSPIIVTPPDGTTRIPSPLQTATLSSTPTNAPTNGRRSPFANPMTQLPVQWCWHRGPITAVRWRRAPRQAGMAGDRLLLSPVAAQRRHPMPLDSSSRTATGRVIQTYVWPADDLRAPIGPDGRSLLAAQSLLPPNPATRSLRLRVTCRCK